MRLLYQTAQTETETYPKKYRELSVSTNEVEALLSLSTTCYESKMEGKN